MDEDMKIALENGVPNVCHQSAIATDFVNHPPHYMAHPSGVECVTIAEHYGFNIGNAIKYLWRSEHKNGVASIRMASRTSKNASGT